MRRLRVGESSRLQEVSLEQVISGQDEVKVTMMVRLIRVEFSWSEQPSRSPHNVPVQSQRKTDRKAMKIKCKA